MKTIVLEKAGGIENLIMKEIDQPIANKNEVIVAVKAISVNPVDYKVRAVEDTLDMFCGTERPVILGWDIAGKIISKGDKVTLFEIGDDVFGMVKFPGLGNAYAEYVSAPEIHLAKMPANVSYVEAAATTLAALTALQALEDNVKKGDRILIQAGSGGVGHFAIQIAKHLGAYVITTCSGKNREFVLSLGADEHIDYHRQKFEEVLSDIDLVLDVFNGEVLLNSVKVMKDGGKIISLPVPNFSEEIMKEAQKRKVNVAFMMVSSNGKDMNTLSKYLSDGSIKVHVSKTFAFSEMGKAHLQLESGRTVGKVVVEV